MMYFAYPEVKINFMRENLLFFFQENLCSKWWRIYASIPIGCFVMLLKRDHYVEETIYEVV